MKPQTSITTTHGLMLVATTIVASSFIVMAQVAEELDATVLTLVRFSLASLFLIPILRIQKLNLPSISDMGRYSVLGLCQAIYFVAMFEALRYTTSINTATLFTLVPWVSGVVAYFLVKERLGAQQITAMLFVAAGALWVIMRGRLENLFHLEFNIGDLIFLISVLAFGVYGPLIKLLHRGEPMLKMTFGTIATALFWLIPFAGYGVLEIVWREVPNSVYLYLLYLAIFPTIGTFFITQFCAVRLGPTRMMAYMYMTPTLVLVLEWMIWQISIPAAAIFGVLLTFAGSIVLHWQAAATSRG